MGVTWPGMEIDEEKWGEIFRNVDIDAMWDYILYIIDNPWASPTEIGKEFGENYQVYSGKVAAAGSRVLKYLDIEKGYDWNGRVFFDCRRSADDRFWLLRATGGLTKYFGRLK